MYVLPDVTLCYQASPVASPVASCPTRTLVEKLGAILESGFDLAFSLILDPGLPLLADEPSGDEVVVVGIEDPLSPLLILEARKELMAHQDFRPIGASASRHARSTAVNVVRGRDLEVAALNVGCSEPIPGSSGPRSLELALDSLAGSNTTNLVVFEGGQDPGNESGWPRHIVIRHDGDSGRYLRESFTDLNALVGNGGIQNTNVGVAQRVG